MNDTGLPRRARPTAQIAEELPSVIVKPSTLTSAPSAGQREQPLMIRSTFSSPMITTCVISDVGLWLRGIAGMEREGLDDAADHMAAGGRVRPEAHREAAKQRQHL